MMKKNLSGVKLTKKGFLKVLISFFLKNERFNNDLQKKKLHCC